MKPKQDTKELEEAKKKQEEYLNDLKRLQAEFENYKKRQEKENSHFKDFANQELLKSLLTIMDDFEHSLNSLDKASKEDLEKTLELLYSKLKNFLELNQVRPFNSKNEKFDPYKHEVLLQQESDKEDIILDEIQKGYYFKDKILRHAKVKISKLGGKQND